VLKAFAMVKGFIQKFLLKQHSTVQA